MGAYDRTGATAHRSRQLITGKCVLNMLGVLAEFETNFRKERQLEGIARAKVARVYTGRQASIDVARVREMKSEGLGRHRDRQGARYWPGERLSGIGGPRNCPGSRLVSTGAMSLD
jgi:hypothetical protein